MSGVYGDDYGYNLNSMRKIDNSEIDRSRVKSELMNSHDRKNNNNLDENSGPFPMNPPHNLSQATSSDADGGLS
jgi:hypothetical protein